MLKNLLGSTQDTPEARKVAEICLSFYKHNIGRADYLKRFAMLVADQLLFAYKPLPVPMDPPESLVEYWRMPPDEKKNHNRRNPGWFTDSEAQKWIRKRNAIIEQNKGCQQHLQEMAEDIKDDSLRALKLRKKAEEYTEHITACPEAERLAKMFEGRVVNQ